MSSNSKLRKELRELRDTLETIVAGVEAAAARKAAASTGPAQKAQAPGAAPDERYLSYLEQQARHSSRPGGRIIAEELLQKAMGQ